MVYKVTHLRQRYLIPLLIVMLLSACHKEDPGSYNMPVSNFVEAVVRKYIYQIALAQQMERQSDDHLLTLAAKIKGQSEESILEISKAASTPVDINNMSLHEEDKRKITELNALSGADHSRRLIVLLIDANQELTALHVRASSSTGVVDEAIRAWAASKLPLLRENLSEVQQIK